MAIGINLREECSYDPVWDSFSYGQAMLFRETLKRLLDIDENTLTGKYVDDDAILIDALKARLENGR